MNYQPHVTILIPIRNVAKYIGPCLDALMDQSYPRDKYVVLLLDNNSDDGTLEIVEKYPADRVKVLQIGVHSPPIKYNKVLPTIKSEIIGFVDGDANVDKDWLRLVVKALENLKVAGASGVILTANSNKLVPRIIGYELQDRYERMPKEITRVATMHVVYKKAVLEEIGGFDESLKTGYDGEIGYRIKNAGYKIINVPEAKVWHNHRATLWGFFKQQYEYGKFAIARYFKTPKMMKGDEVTSLWMISQPLFYFASLIFLISYFLFATPLWLAVVPVGILLVSYLYSSIRLAWKFKDISALFLMVIYVIRVWGWGLGALAGIMMFITKKNSI